MAHLPLLDELAIIAALAVVVSVVLSRLRLPTVAGLLLAGALAGPFGSGLVHSVASIEVLAEVGVVLLLFTIGLEFSLARLRAIARQVVLGGSVQVGVTTVAALGVVMALGRPAGEGLFYGFVYALSSTAIVLRALAERRELDAPHGRFIVGALIFQDLCVIPMVLVVPLLGETGDANGAAFRIALALGKAALVVVATVAGARFVVPRLLGWVDASRSREVFLLAVLGLCIGTAWLTSRVGLSLALGAFLGGMVVADTQFGHRAMGDVLPLRDAFVSIFFVSLGMLFDGRTVLEHPLLVGVLFAGFLLAKGALASFAAAIMRFPARAAFLAGAGLAQFGEFGFVLVDLGVEAKVIEPEASRPLLAAGIASMFVTPLLVRLAPHFTAGERLLAPLAAVLGARGIADAPVSDLRAREGHVVVVGYGVAGRLVADALQQAGVAFVVLELNAEVVREASARGRPVYYADATSREALEHAGIARARALVLVMNDPAAVMRIVDTVRRIVSDLPILVRAHYLAERRGLEALGATEVVAEEVEGAVEIVARVLRRLDVPRNVIDVCLADARAATGPAARAPSVPPKRLGDTAGLEELRIEAVSIREGAYGEGKAPLALDLRRRTGALIVAVRRGGHLLEGFDPSAPLAAGDVAYLVGPPAALAAASRLLDAPVDGGAGA
jgi:CPA2 family monovalent cation:H+ antiporter-2